MSERCGLDVWRESAEATGTRQLAIVALLRPFLDSQREHDMSRLALALLMG
jgi:hypothetical protein